MSCSIKSLIFLKMILKIELKKKSLYQLRDVYPLHQTLNAILLQKCNIAQGLLKDGQESFSKIYKLFFRRYMPKPH